MINLKLQEHELERLMKLVYLGNWLINSCRAESDAKYDALVEKVFALAEKAGRPEYADYEQELKAFVPSAVFEQEAQAYVNKYNTAIFWEELVLHLARRDLNKKGRYYPETTDLAGMRKWSEEVEKAEKKYSAEFSRRGLGNLVLRLPSAKRPKPPSK